MKKIGIIVLLLFSILIFTTAAYGQNEPYYHLKLLAVQETGNQYLGSDADLFLELKEGTGRVFLDTYPLTKLDTQISTRFAKEIACKHFKLNCNQYDFIFTIKAESNIVGGPSAGAAIAALTTIAVMNLDYDQDVTITGTINSGGIIGPVGGAKEKLEAAAKANLKKVLIAKGMGKQKNFNELKLMEGEKENNETVNQSIPNTNNITNNTLTNESLTLDLIQYGKENLSLEVVEVMDLDEVISALTGTQLNQKEVQIIENPEYQKIMKSLQEILCSRTKQIESELNEAKVQLNQSLREEFVAKKGRAKNASLENDYYSAASFCFGNNIFLKQQLYAHQKPNRGTVTKLFAVLERKNNALAEKIESEKIETISDLQTVMIVKERLAEVSEQINKSRESINLQPLTESYYYLAYAEERFFSALSWMQFFSMEGRKFVFDKNLLKDSCQQKISEAEERHQYVILFLNSFFVSGIQEKIDSAKSASDQEEYELCLIQSSQAKAEADAILSSMGLSEENFAEFLESKIKAVEKVISENNAEDIFPILGYSYYQYANTLKEQEKYNALVYLEYALEMSDLSLYFPEEQESAITTKNGFEFDSKWVFMLGGFLIGVLLMGIITVLAWHKFKKKTKLKLMKRIKQL